MYLLTLNAPSKASSQDPKDYGKANGRKSIRPPRCCICNNIQLVLHTAHILRPRSHQPLVRSQHRRRNSRLNIITRRYPSCRFIIHSTCIVPNGSYPVRIVDIQLLVSSCERPDCICCAEITAEPKVDAAELVVAFSAESRT
jgi:hypothetical protein